MFFAFVCDLRHRECSWDSLHGDGPAGSSTGIAPFPKWWAAAAIVVPVLQRQIAALLLPSPDLLSWEPWVQTTTTVHVLFWAGLSNATTFQFLWPTAPQTCHGWVVSPCSLGVCVGPCFWVYFLRVPFNGRQINVFVVEQVKQKFFFFDFLLERRV